MELLIYPNHAAGKLETRLSLGRNWSPMCNIFVHTESKVLGKQ